MYIRAEDPEGENWHVYFNDKLMLHAIAADDTLGFVEVIDQEWLKRVAPLDSNETSSINEEIPEELEELCTKKIYGKVKFVRVLVKEE